MGELGLENDQNQIAEQLIIVLYTLMYAFSASHLIVYTHFESLMAHI